METLRSAYECLADFFIDYPKTVLCILLLFILAASAAFAFLAPWAIAHAR